MGPLSDVRIIEFAGIGPAPLAAMLLADMGATVLLIDRIADAGLGVKLPPAADFTKRNRAILHLDLKRPEAIASVLRLIDGADALIEGFRPGVMERLGLGPDVCLARNRRLAYGRVTGWGQEGPLSQAAGHDMNYIALTGALHAIGRAGQPPTPPLNLVGDYGGGALYLVTGLLAAIISARSTGQGQVVDAAMVDGALSLMTPIYGMKAGGRLNDPRGHNQLDSGAYFYEVYECADGEYISVASIEAKFHAELLRRLARGEGDPGGEIPHPHPRRLVRVARRHRRLLRPGPVNGRGARPSAQCCAQCVYRHRGCRAAGTGTTIFAQQGAAAASARHRRCAQDAGGI